MCILKLRNADGAVLIPCCENTFLNSTGGAAEHRCNVTASKHLRYTLPAVIHTSYQDTVSSCIIKMSSSGRIIQTSLKLTERLILQQTYSAAVTTSISDIPFRPVTSSHTYLSFPKWVFWILFLQLSALYMHHIYLNIHFISCCFSYQLIK